jgi:hypothetical protein
MIYGPFNEFGIWRKRYNRELYKLSDELDVVKVIKIGILRWLGHLFKRQEVDPCRKLLILNQKALV